MNKTYETLQQLINTEIIKLEDWYTITCNRGNLELQGDYNPNIVRFLRGFNKSGELLDYSEDIDANAYVSISFTYNSCSVRVCLTD